MRCIAHSWSRIFDVHFDFMGPSPLDDIIIGDIGISLELIAEADFVCWSRSPLAVDVMLLHESVDAVQGKRRKSMAA